MGYPRPEGLRGLQEEGLTQAYGAVPEVMVRRIV